MLLQRKEPPLFPSALLVVTRTYASAEAFDPIIGASKPSKETTSKKISASPTSASLAPLPHVLVVVRITSGSIHIRSSLSTTKTTSTTAYYYSTTAYYYS